MFVRSLFLLFLSASMVAADRHPLLQAGPMAGHVDIVEAHLWIQTKAPADVKMRYWPAGKKDQALETRVKRTDEAAYFTARFNITDLEDNTEYHYAAIIEGKEAKLPYQPSFKTQKFWRFRTDPPPIKLMMGSCLYVNDAKFNRPGTPYGDEFEILEVMTRMKPDAMLWLGDNVYMRETDFFTAKRAAFRWKHTRGYEGIQEMLAYGAHYATWDDHDYGPNDSHRSYPLKHVTLDLFKHYWPNPSYGMPDNPGVYTVISWGDLDIFMMDDRTYRASNKLNDPSKPYWGKKQMDWLKDQLLSSYAPFKMVVNGNQVTNQYDSLEGFTNYPAEYNELMQFLKDHDIPGVMFISGDRHHTELLRTKRPDNYPLYEFTCSPITAGLSGPRGAEEENPLRVPGTLVTNKRNFGIMEVTGPRKERVLKITSWDSTGAQRWSHEIKAEELRKPKRSW